MEERKIAIVTGASRGIGRATAVELAKTGYYVVINYNSSEAAAAETLAQVQAAGAEGEVQKFDVANAEEVKEALARIVGEHKRIDVLVNNAGVTADGLFLMMGEEEWHKVIDTIKSMIPMARVGKPEEVARVIRFLCSDDASYITGQVIGINGGMF
jgi:3-oxoacyl-[acyl-carrier protein] reductase